MTWCSSHAAHNRLCSASSPRIRSTSGTAGLPTSLPTGLLASLLAGCALVGCGGAQTGAAENAEPPVLEVGAAEGDSPSRESDADAPTGGLTIADATAGPPSVVLTGDAVQVGEERAPLPHAAELRSIPLIRERLAPLLGLPARTGDELRVATREVRPYLIRIAPEVRGAETVSALFSAGFDGLPISRVEPYGSYLYVFAATPPDDPPLQARLRWPERALSVQLTESALVFSRIEVASDPDGGDPDAAGAADGAGATSPAKGGVAPTPSARPLELPADASAADVGAALAQLCTKSEPCSPFVLNPGPKSRAAQLFAVLEAMDARPEFSAELAPPPRAYVLGGKPEKVAHGLKKLRAGSAAVGGRLPAEMIRDTVRESFGAFRTCYEEELKKDPELDVRVMVRFVIGRNGSVVNAAGSAEPERPELVSCVVQAFRALTFPKPEGGIVNVTYPIRFSPG